MKTALSLACVATLIAIVLYVATSGTSGPRPPRSGTMDYYATQNAAEATRRAIVAPMTDTLNCLAAGYSARECTQQLGD